MTLKWKILIGVGILLLAVGITYGYRHYADLAERAGIIEDQEAIVKELEKADKEHITEEERLYRLLALAEQKEKELCKQYADLQTQIKNIVVPTNPSDLANAFRKRGFKSGRIVIRSK
jgi:protein subunit release factor A